MDRDADGRVFLHALRGEVTEEERVYPEFDGEGDVFSEEPEFPVSFMKIHEAIQRFNKHELSRNDLAQSVETLMVRCSTLLPRLENSIATAAGIKKVAQSVIDEFTQAGGLFSDGLQEALRGMEELLACDDSEARQTIHAAWDKMQHGGQRIMTARSRCGELYASLCVEVANHIQ
jgi:hypothetical protein